MKIISFSLWGPTDNYNFGAIENSLRAKELFPDYIVKIFHDDTVNFNIIDKLKDFDNVKLINVNTLKRLPIDKSMWRFLPAFEEETDILIVRDLDSQLTERDKLFHEQWLKTNNDFHIIRDNKGHLLKIPAGMWDCRNKIILKYKEDFYNFYVKPFKLSNRPLGFGMDQFFLEQKIYHNIINNALIHSINKELIREGEKEEQIIFVKRSHQPIGCSAKQHYKALKYLGLKNHSLKKTRYQSFCD